MGHSLALIALEKVYWRLVLQATVFREAWMLIGHMGRGGAV